MDTTARLHARLRWLGPALTLPAAAIVLGLLWRALSAGGGFGALFVGVAALMASIATFGLNDDTLLAELIRLEQRRALPDDLRAELREERRRRPTRLHTLEDSTLSGKLIPLVALTFLTWAAWLLLKA